ncbi:MAG: universal stress protein [Desulfobulbaceae bacterium]|nr:universal stress protein [Desulfobulbaceae bacterium]
MHVKKILLPLDGSDHSMHAAKYTVELAKLTDAEVVLAHCFGGIPKLLGEDGLHELIGELTKESNEILEPFVWLFHDKGIKYRKRVVRGRIADAVVTLAEEENVDLIVIGSRGLSNVERILLGSVTTRVVQMAHCPVLVMR